MQDLNKTSLFPSTFITWQNKYRKAIIFTFFGLYFITGCIIYNDYGISWDESISRYNGIVTLKYLITKVNPELIINNASLQGIPNLHEWKDKDYGVVFEVPLVILENVFGIKNNYSPELYYLRHFCTFLFFYLGVVHLFLLIQFRFNSWHLGMLGCLLFILSPRIFADSFYNDKDIVLLSAFIITSYYLLRYLSNKSFWNAFWLGISMAVTINIRITGIVIPAIAFTFILIDIIKLYPDVKKINQSLSSALLLLITLITFTIIFWPYLWENPLQNFLQAFHNMSKFRWHNHVLYAGEFIWAANVPWHYIPVWIAITTPVVYLIFFITGLIPIFIHLWQVKLYLYKNEPQRQDLVITSLFFGPLLAVIVMDSVLYDAWRQMFFLYGSFIYIAIRGVVYVKESAARHKILRIDTLYTYVLGAIVAFSLIHTTYFMVKYHPHQNVYFNFLAGNNPGENFERDYWGLSYRQGLEYIIENDKRETITVTANMLASGRTNIRILPEEMQKRLNFSNSKDTSDYFLTEHRFTGGYKWYPDENKFEEIHSIIVDNIKIMSIYKAKSLSLTN
ncbi:hypothetical protein Q0590_13775 [Rhodocytophaga aerolata]|uniref:Glycosyltransferase RgtA/B/C/D-like domain-containing protein n=1 Tax=Rhodocytophaga aerolata TaxID=455078 RepID=A0ABT8R5G9_9BACT|nr:glycosyltransferase family 39 protein [Rhodocytophaga aerolata]MDO1447332.1 hypothetical protein [Rhodocytophaga aerolata]